MKSPVLVGTPRGAADPLLHRLLLAAEYMLEDAGAIAVMAILAVSRDLHDLRARLGAITVAHSYDGGKPVTAGRRAYASTTKAAARPPGRTTRAISATPLGGSGMKNTTSAITAIPTPIGIA